MKRKTILILLPILLLLAILLYRSAKIGTLKSEQENLVIEDISVISKIIISDDKETLLLQKREGNWKINSKYIARDEAIFNILKILNQLQIQSPVPNSQLYSINNTFLTHFIEVKVFDENSELKSFKISKKRNSKGSYFLAKNAKKPLIMHVLGMKKDLLSYFNVNTQFWRTKVVFDYFPTEIKSLEVIYPTEKENSFKIEVDKNIQFYDSENEELINFSLEKVKNYLSLFREIKYKKLLFKEEISKDSLQKKEATIIFKITDKENNKNSLKLYKKYNLDGQLDFNLLHGFQDEQIIFEITYFELDPILKERNHFIE